MATKTITIEDVKIQGTGDSLWTEEGETSADDSYVINRLEINDYDGKIKNFASVDIYGEETHRHQYTDNGIEAEVIKLFTGIIQKSLQRKIKQLMWSEHCLQADDGWNFDVSLVKKED